MKQLVFLWYFLTYSVLFDIPTYILSPIFWALTSAILVHLKYPPSYCTYFNGFSSILIKNLLYYLMGPLLISWPLETLTPPWIHTSLHIFSIFIHFHAAIIISFSHMAEKNHSLYTEHILLFISWGHTMWFNCIATVKRAVTNTYCTCKYFYCRIYSLEYAKEVTVQFFCSLLR